MDNSKIKSSDLGQFEKIFLASILKYKLEAKKDDILKYLGQAIFGEINEIVLATKLINDIHLDFGTATDLAFDLQTDILEKLDQEGVAAIKKRIKDRETQMYAPLIISDELLKNLDYEIKNPIIRKRFDDAIFSYFKDIRDMAELQENLIRPSKTGGVEMPVEVFYNLQKLLLAKKDELAKAGVNIAEIIADYEKQLKNGEFTETQEEEIDVVAKPVRPEIVKEKITGAEVTIDQLLEEKNIAMNNLANKQEPKEKELADQGKVNPLIKEIKEEERFLESLEELPEPEKLAPPPPAPVAVSGLQPAMEYANQQARVPQPMIKKIEKPSRPKMEDVKFTTQLYGPIDELNSLSITDFRRLSKDAKQATEKIKQKIDLLEEDSIEKKAAGLRALKNSPLYKIYADIMNKAIMEGRSFEQIISQRQDMSVAEFKAIMDLNKSLKY